MQQTNKHGRWNLAEEEEDLVKLMMSCRRNYLCLCCLNFFLSRTVVKKKKKKKKSNRNRLSPTALEKGGSEFMSQFCNSYNGFSQFCLPLCVCLRSFPPLIFSCLPIQSWRSSSCKKASFVISAWFVCNAGIESACKWNPAVRSCFPTSCQIFSGVPNVSAQVIGGHMKKGRKGVNHMLPRNKETTFGNRDLILLLLCLWQDLTN